MRMRTEYLGKRKKTHNPREGWEDGTPPPHRDFKERRAALFFLFVYINAAKQESGT